MHLVEEHAVAASPPQQIPLPVVLATLTLRFVLTRLCVVVRLAEDAIVDLQSKLGGSRQQPLQRTRRFCTALRPRTHDPPNLNRLFRPCTSDAGSAPCRLRAPSLSLWLRSGGVMNCSAVSRVIGRIGASCSRLSSRNSVHFLPDTVPSGSKRHSASQSSAVVRLPRLAPELTWRPCKPPYIYGTARPRDSATLRAKSICNAACKVALI